MSTPEWLYPYVRPYKDWMDRQRKNPPEKISVERAQRFVLLEDVALWLSHPDNWFNGYLDIIKWNGSVPSISEHHAWKLAPGCPEREYLLKVVMWKQKGLKVGKKTDDDPTDEHDTEGV